MVRYASELTHYGVKGMKWGVRRFQNPDGSYTSAGVARYRKSNNSVKTKTINTNSKSQVRSYLKDVQKIYDSLSEKDKYYLTTTHDGKYERLGTKNDSTFKPPIYAKVIYSKGNPVGFIDVHKDYVNNAKIDIAIHPEHRGKGYSKLLTKNIVSTIMDSHPEVDYLDWIVHRNNTSSIKIAEKLGFTNYGLNAKGFLTFSKYRR